MTPEPEYDPRAKLALVVSVTVAALTNGSLPQVTVLLGALVAFVVVTGALPVHTWLRILKPVMYLVPVLVVLNSFFYAGGAVWGAINIGPVRLALTAGGLETAVLIGFRLLGIAGAAAWFAGTTEAEEFELALTRLGVPWSFAFLLSLTLRLVPEMRQRFQVIEDAQRSRGADLSGGPIDRIRARIPMVLPFLVAVIRYGFELSEVLTARGFDDIEDRTSLIQIEHRPADYVLYIVALVVLVIGVLG